MSDEHTSLIKTPKQLLIVVLLAFAIPIVVISLVAHLVANTSTNDEVSQNAIISNIRPVGQVVIGQPAAPKGSLGGEQVYTTVCKACHETGVAGALKFGDKAAWAKVLAQGAPVTFQHDINGIRAMPPRGGNPDLTDAEVQRAAVYMVNHAGGSWKEPTPAPASTGTAPPATGAAPTSATAAPASGGAAAAAPAASASAAPTVASAATPAAASAGAKPDGKKVYDSVCAACHAAGLLNAPKFGDKAAWAPRIQTGMPALYTSAIKGKGAMPPKGGSNLPDADIQAAVDYMTAAAK